MRQGGVFLLYLCDLRAAVLQEGRVLHAYLYRRSQAAAEMGGIWLGAARAAAAESGDIPGFLHGAGICAARVRPARHYLLWQSCKAAEGAVRDAGRACNLLMEKAR